MPASRFTTRILPGATTAGQTRIALDDLLAQAEHYAEHSMRSDIGRLPPTLFLIGSEGPLMFMPESLADESEKDDFATTARLMCIAHAATSVVMALEAWVKYAKPGERFDETEAPSEAFDRQEVVVLMGESRSGLKQKFLPIIRSDNGNFFGFGESEVPEMDEMKGRFAWLLPTKMPDEAIREVAKVLLGVKGVGRVTQAPGGGVAGFQLPGDNCPTAFIRSRKESAS